MPLHSFIEYLKYRWKAKSRHGIHSPFVYDLIERVLLDKSYIKKDFIVQYRALPLRYENLISRLAAYYNYQEVQFLLSGKEGEINPDTGLLVLNETEPRQWSILYDKYAYLLKDHSMVVVPFIHKTLAHTIGWKRLYTRPGVRVSIDLYGMGLLLFREEFKEKQHFVLKY